MAVIYKIGRRKDEWPMSSSSISKRILASTNSNSTRSGMTPGKSMSVALLTPTRMVFFSMIVSPARRASWTLIARWLFHSTMKFTISLVTGKSIAEISTTQATPRCYCMTPVAGVLNSCSLVQICHCNIKRAFQDGEVIVFCTLAILAFPH